MSAGKISALVTLLIIAIILGAFVFQVLIAPGELGPPTHVNLNPNNQNMTWENGVTEKNLKNVAFASSNFALELLSHILNESDNTIISPLSIWLALAMLYEGARGTTAEEMRKVMYLPEDRQVLEENIHWFLENFGNQSENYALKIADALWVQQNFNIRQEYVHILQDYYNAYFQYLNFAGDPDGSRKIINSWVENHTNGKIKDLLPPGSINPETVSVLTNAIYFYATWRHPFNESLTNKEFFYTPHGKVLVDMMHKENVLKYTEDDDTQVLELPYRNSNLSMLVLLPKHNTLNLSFDKLVSYRKNLGDAEVNLSFPKFTLTTPTYSLKKPLEKMGLREIFEPSANLTGMFPYGGIFAEDVYHKAYISVDEKGTEAAAATGIPQAAAAPPPMPHVNFTVDHPFLFIIQDRNTGAIFFLGWVADPTA